MKVELDNLISITEANQNISKVAQMVDEKGAAVILKNNTPKYVIIDYNKLQNETIADDILVQEAATEYLTKYSKAFEELAK
ncbi:MAG TPA: type II toxin-antitoxin system Phd/YefM family antitoxin [Lachnospiraceae bacterium]|nr:type II toxin-antitoxin system Phd/YefM family antitoxin [Lachnospiraceae bacterium]